MTYVSDAFTVRINEKRAKKLQRSNYDRFISNAISELKQFKLTYCFTLEQAEEVKRVIDEAVTIALDKLNEMYLIKIVEE